MFYALLLDQHAHNVQTLSDFANPVVLSQSRER